MPETFIGLRIKKIRKRRKLSQWQLAKKCEIPQSSISTFECGYRTPSEEERVALAKSLGTTVKFDEEF